VNGARTCVCLIDRRRGDYPPLLRAVRLSATRTGEGLIDRRLNLGGRAPEGSDRARVRHRDVAVGVHDLVRQGDELTGSRARLDREEESTRLGLEDSDAHDVADAERDPRWGPGKALARRRRFGATAA
jgi:hypothetical protein